MTEGTEATETPENKAEISGYVDFDVNVRFTIKDPAALVKRFPKEWRALTAEELKAAGREEWERFDHFLGELLGGIVEVNVNVPSFWDEMKFNETVSWSHENWRWTQEDAEALALSLPKDLSFIEGQPDYDPMKDMTPQPDDQELPFKEATNGDEVSDSEPGAPRPVRPGARTRGA